MSDSETIAAAPKTHLPTPADPTWLGLHDAILSGWFNQETGEVMTGFRVTADDIVIDVGCGDGGAACFCARQGAHIILADQDEARLAATAERVRADGPRGLDVHITDANPLPVADGTATRVICTEVLEHVDDPRAFAAELVRVGKPGSLYLITVPGAAQEHVQEDLAPPAYFEKPNHIRIFETEDFHALVEQSGLEIVYKTQYGFFWSIWFAFFWQADVPLGKTDATLQLWTDTWNHVLSGRDGLRIKKQLDAVFPKSQVVVARKPG